MLKRSIGIIQHPPERIPGLIPDRSLDDAAADAGIHFVDHGQQIGEWRTSAQGLDGRLPQVWIGIRDEGLEDIPPPRLAEFPHGLLLDRDIRVLKERKQDVVLQGWIQHHMG
jgi:hypothetical protein